MVKGVRAINSEAFGREKAGSGHDLNSSNRRTKRNVSTFDQA